MRTPSLPVSARPSRSLAATAVSRSRTGAVVPLREYLEHVWAAVFEGGPVDDLQGRRCQWLGTRCPLDCHVALDCAPDPSGTNGNGSPEEEIDEVQEAEDEDSQDRPFAGGSYAIEFDAARKIAQGLGANLDALKSVVEVKGKTARLLLVSEREPFLFARLGSSQPVSRTDPTHWHSPDHEARQVKTPGQRSAGVRRE